MKNGKTQSERGLFEILKRSGKAKSTLKLWSIQKGHWRDYSNKFCKYTWNTGWSIIKIRNLLIQLRQTLYTMHFWTQVKNVEVWWWKFVLKSLYTLLTNLEFVDLFSRNLLLLNDFIILLVDFISVAFKQRMHETSKPLQYSTSAIHFSGVLSSMSASNISLLSAC